MAFGGKTPFFFPPYPPSVSYFWLSPVGKGPQRPPPQDPAPCPRMGPKPHREELKEAVYGKYPNFREKKETKKGFSFPLGRRGGGGGWQLRPRRGQPSSVTSGRVLSLD